MPALPLNFENMKQHEIAQIILEEVCNTLSLRVEDVASKCRKREWADARKIVAFIIRSVKPNLSLQLIADLLHKDDHSTISNAVSGAKDLLLTDRVFRDNLMKCGRAVTQRLQILTEQEYTENIVLQNQVKKILRRYRGQTRVNKFVQLIELYSGNVKK